MSGLRNYRKFKYISVSLGLNSAKLPLRKITDLYINNKVSRQVDFLYGCVKQSDGISLSCYMSLLPDTYYFGSRMRRECRERVSDPDMHHGTCVTHVPWCLPGSLSSGFLWSRWRGKRTRHSSRMRNPQLNVSGKSPMDTPMLGPFTVVLHSSNDLMFLRWFLRDLHSPTIRVVLSEWLWKW